MIKRHILSTEDEVITSTMSTNCVDCIRNNCTNGYAHIECGIDNLKKRIALISNSQGTLLACSGDSKTTKLFKEHTLSIAESIKTIISLRKDVEKEVADSQQSRVDRVIHNLKSINAHSIQELYGLIPQSSFTKNLKSTISIVENAIKNKPQKAATTFLRIAKLNMSVKAEFSVYEKLLKDDPELSFREYGVRDVLMIVLYMFFGDFTDDNVYVNVSNYYEKAKFDFESVQVALYHIIENAAKYVKPQSTININFNKLDTCHTITFEMQSIHVLSSERERIFEEGYSGVNAEKLGKSGKGIGMYRVKRLLSLNNINFIAEFGDTIFMHDKIEYSNNKFNIIIPVH